MIRRLARLIAPPNAREPTASVDGTATDIRDAFHAIVAQWLRVRNRRPFTLDASLCSTAQTYSRRMDKEEFFGHVDPSGVMVTDRLDMTIDAEYVGENIIREPVPTLHQNQSTNRAPAYCPTTVAWVLFHRFLNSNPHRETLQQSWTHHGVGVHLSYEGRLVHLTHILVNRPERNQNTH